MFWEQLNLLEVQGPPGAFDQAPDLVPEQHFGRAVQTWADRHGPQARCGSLFAVWAFSEQVSIQVRMPGHKLALGLSKD